MRAAPSNFKRQINDTELVEAVVCLANGSGGHLVVGVTDEGRVVGAKLRHGDRTDPDRIEALILSRTRPSVQVNATVITADGKDVLAVAVPTGTTVVATSGGKYLRRAVGVTGEPVCLPMEPHEVLARVSSVGAQDFSGIPLRGVGLNDLSSAELVRYRRLAASGGDRALADLSDGDLLGALGLQGDSGGLAVGALLLFGREDVIGRKLPAYEIGLQELEGLEVRSGTTSTMPLLRAMIEAFDWIKVRNPEEEVQIGLFRLPLPRFADDAVRELLANALVHRDYTMAGPTLIEIRENGLGVSNPGGFPEGINLGNLLTVPPRARNPGLADAFKRAGLVERTGRGIDRAFLRQLEVGRPVPDYGRTNGNSVVVRLRAGPADRELAGYVAEVRRAGRDFSLEDLLVLHEVRKERHINSTRAGELLQVGEREAREVLNRLADRGLLEARGRTKGRSYHLAASLYRRFGELSEYVRARGFNRIQQEQMVLTFVDRHGSIARREAADLCRIDSEQASRLLRRLRDEGSLEMVGRRRSARYVKPQRTTELQT